MKATTRSTRTRAALNPQVAIVAVILGAAIAFLAVKLRGSSAEASRLQAANAALEAQVTQLTSERDSFKAQVGEIARLKKDNEEIHKLRNEVTRFRALQPEFEKLQQQAAQLQAQLQQQQNMRAEAQRQMQQQAAQFQQAESQRAATDAQRICIENLGYWLSATAQWAADHPDVAATRAPTLAELVGPDRYLTDAPVCPSGGRYTLAGPGQVPTCSIAGHQLQVTK